MEDERSRRTKPRKVASILAIIGGCTSAVCGGVVLTHYAVARVAPLPASPLFGFIGSVLGILVILGGICTIRRRIVLGGSLAMLCGVGNFQGGGFPAAIEVVDYIIHKLVGGFNMSSVGVVLALTFSIFFPLFAGAYALMSGRNQK